jgi:hypothetical protein
MQSESVGPNWSAYVKANFRFYDHCCDLCSHAAWINVSDRLLFAGKGNGAWYRMSCESPGPDGMNDSGLQTTPDFNGRPEETAWSDVIEHGWNLEYQTTKAERWLGRINTQFNVGYFLEDFE